MNLILREKKKKSVLIHLFIIQSFMTQIKVVYYTEK